jgi:hypothetical protein
MGSSGGSANPMFLSQGGRPMPGLPIAGQGAPNDNPRNFGQFQEFLPEIAPAGRAGNQILPAGQGPAPSARGLTSEMFQYRSPSGAVAPGGGGGAGDIDSLRQQVAALQAQAGNGQFGAARGGQQPGFGLYGQQSGIGFPINWTNSNNPNVTS